MRTRLLAAFLAGLLAASPLSAASAASTIQRDFQQLVSRVQAKIQRSETAAEAYADEIRDFDALLARYPKDKSNAVAEVLLMKGMLYFEVLQDPDQALVAFRQLKVEFPETDYGRRMDELIANLEQQAVSMRLQGALKVGSSFPLFAVQDTAGAALSLESYRGKVVLVDFWAMWCGPCIAELPNVVKAYKDYNARGFEIVGISLDRAGEGPKLARFTQENAMPWRQFFDGKYWANELAQKYGVNSIPATYLLDGEGRILAKNLRGPALAAAIEKALPKK
jgi:peroxiredoxin